MNLIRRFIRAFRSPLPAPQSEDGLSHALTRASLAREDFDKQMAEFEERMADLRREANWLYVNKG